MIEDLAWKMFCLTGNIEEYLLYKETGNKMGSPSAQNAADGKAETEEKGTWS